MGHSRINATGDVTATLLGATLVEQVLSMNVESPGLKTRGVSNKYNPAVEKIRTSFQNSEVSELKAEVSRLKEEVNVAQKVIADLHQQNQALRQQVLTPEKCDRFLTESFRVTEFP